MYGIYGVTFTINKKPRMAYPTGGCWDRVRDFFGSLGLVPSGKLTAYYVLK